MAAWSAQWLAHVKQAVALFKRVVNSTIVIRERHHNKAPPLKTRLMSISKNRMYNDIPHIVAWLARWLAHVKQAVRTLK